MQEFVFLPDRKADAQSSFDTLSQTVSGTARISMSLQAAAPGRGGFTKSSLEAANNSIKASAKSASDDSKEIEIVDFVERTGAVLLSAAEIPSPKQFKSGSIHPVIYYQPAVAEVRVGRSKLKLSSGPAATDFLQIKLQFSDTGRPVKNAVANLRLVGESEVSAVSDEDGVVTFGIRIPSVSGARLLVEPGFAGHWGFMEANATFASGDVVDIERINLTSTKDALRYMIAQGGPADGVGVRVGVVDSGVGPHTDLPNVDGDEDSSIGHGTHVAGIIAGKGANSLGGVAPGVDILSYRVFADPSTGIARNFEIHRAIEQAVEDGCHLVNLSLKSEFPLAPKQDDPVISRALEDAAEAGTLCVAAAGNDFRRFVAFPARHKDALAVSAVGWEPGMPANAFDRWTVTDDRSTVDSDIFFANFSNEGVDSTRVDLTGPGAGIVSTVPGDTYAPMSGTSMACPAIVGAISRLLSANPAVLDLPADQTRTDAFRHLIKQNLVKAGFNRVRQGGGTLE
ncbi:MAG: S8 family serine peptidase [Pseudomonadota bacterium]